ncbi:MAG: tRNA epoxyqueuosine(34) reductase QueG [Thermoanaerobaculia bacterium]
MLRLSAARGVSTPVDRLLAVRAFREEADREGFSRVGIAAAGPPPRFERYREWIARERHAGMDYLRRSVTQRADPEAVLSGVRSIVCLSYPYPASAPVAADGSRIARYAVGPDYHGTLRQRAQRVAARVAERVGDFRFRACVDSAPLSERAFAAAAGVGWIGKNGCLIDPERGSFLLLAEILTDLDLPADSPLAEQCGSCVRCLSECPTSAFLEPGILDASRCVAYWTIEHRGPIPDEIKPHIAENVFGCDICQEVCPWNAPLLRDAQPGAVEVPTRAEWLATGPGAWRRRWSATALGRAGRRGVQRNAAISGGACGERSMLPAVTAAGGTAEPGLADAARWAAASLAASGD